MTLDLIFHGATAATRTLDQLARDLGVSVDLLDARTTAMEIFAATVLTVRLDGPTERLDAAGPWFARRGIHRLAAA